MEQYPADTCRSPLVAVSWSSSSLAITRVDFRRGRISQYTTTHEVLPEGSIDADTGEIVRQKPLEAAIQRISRGKSKLLRGSRIVMAIPSALVFVYSWRCKPSLFDRPEREVLEEVAGTLPGDRTTLVARLARPIEHGACASNAMLVAARERAVLAYLALLDGYHKNVVSVSTAELARYNLACLLYRMKLSEPLLVTSIDSVQAEVTVWYGGAIWFSERVAFESYSGSSELAFSLEDLADIGEFFSSSPMRPLAVFLKRAIECSAERGMRLRSALFYSPCGMRDLIKKLLQSHGISSSCIDETAVLHAVSSAFNKVTNSQQLLDSLRSGKFYEVFGLLACEMSQVFRPKTQAEVTTAA